jgi:hypothetical protein
MAEIFFVRTRSSLDSKELECRLLERSNQGYRLKARTPAQALMKALGVAEIRELIRTEEIIEPLTTAA